MSSDWDWSPYLTPAAQGLFSAPWNLPAGLQFGAPRWAAAMPQLRPPAVSLPAIAAGTIAGASTIPIGPRPSGAPPGQAPSGAQTFALPLPKLDASSGPGQAGWAPPSSWQSPFYVPVNMRDESGNVPIYPWGAGPPPGPPTTPQSSPAATPAGSPPPQAIGSWSTTSQPAAGSAGTAPPGINQKWWDQFAKEHGGQTAGDFYGAQGEGLAEALADREWSEQFAAANGRPPNDDEWRNWWFQSRTGGGPPSGGDADALKAFRQRMRAIYGAAMRDATRERPPLWVPPATVWR